MSARQRGFTLLELMVALAILGLLSVMLLGGVRFGFRAWERETAHADAIGDIGTAQDFLRRSIGAAYPLYRVDDPGHGRIAFTAAADRLEYLAPELQGHGGAGKRRYILMKESAGDRSDLVLLSQPELASDTTVLSRTVLIGGIKDLAFEYFGRASADEGGAWSSQWDDPLHLPELIRVRVSFAGNDFRQWPDLVVAPRIVVDVNCTYDPLTHGCRGR